jgi:polyribonucleotide nucleotidyltransferase
LGTLFSDKLPTEEKINVIENEYDIPMTQDLKEEMDGMCNLSQGIVERTTKKVTEEVTKEVTKEVTREVTKEVTDRINRLNTILINSNRYDDLKRSTEDKDFQNKLLDELVPMADNE